MDGEEGLVHDWGRLCGRRLAALYFLIWMVVTREFAFYVFINL